MQIHDYNTKDKNNNYWTFSTKEPTNNETCVISRRDLHQLGGFSSCSSRLRNKATAQAEAAAATPGRPWLPQRAETTQHPRPMAA